MSGKFEMRVVVRGDAVHLFGHAQLDVYSTCVTIVALEDHFRKLKASLLAEVDEEIVAEMLNSAREDMHAHQSSN